MIRSWFAALLFILSPNTFAGDYPFAVNGVRNGVQTILIASNRGPGTVSVHLDVTGSNIGSNRSLPIVAVVPPNSEMELARLFPAHPGTSQLQWTTSFMLGNINAQADPQALYRLPYLDGYSFTLGQSPGGHITTHLTAESRDAVDITMPEGTPIIAVRDGVVVRTEARFANQGALDPAMLDKANYVEIEHFDGTIAQYAHLRHGGVIVSPGQRVMAGDIISYSGSTGYSGGPHLHFAIQVTRMDSHNKFSRVSMPFMFYVGTPATAFKSVEGLLATADYGSRAAIPKMPIPPPQASQSTAVVKVRQASGQESGTKVKLEISGPYVDFIAGLPGWVLYAGTVAVVLLVFSLLRPKEDEYSRNEPRL